MNEKKKLEKKSIYSRCADSRPNDDCNDIVVCEILSRLPVKSLMRFKCVCKHWRDLIQEDPYFIDLQLTRSKTRPGLFIVIPLQASLKAGMICGLQGYTKGGRCKKVPDQELYLRAQLLGGPHQVRAAINDVMQTKSFSEYNEILPPINGLICMVDSKVHYRVRIYNPSAREITPWMKSTLLMNQQEGDRFDVFNDDMFPTYQFGFDPATKDYKVLCVWSTNREEVSEVLTVGQTKWRRVRDEIPSNNFYDGNSVYANGCIYWIVYECLTVFDVGNEKFRVIPVPNCISDQPRDCGQNVELLDDQVDGRADLFRRMSVYEGREVGLLEMGGHVTVFRRMSDYTAKLWIFNEDTKENTSNECWSELTIMLPFCWAGDGQCVYIHTVPGTDEIIFETYRDCLDRRIEYASLYSYNWKKKIFTELKLSGIPSSVPEYRASLFSTFFESLVPIQKAGEAGITFGRK
ncbi:putative F-box protein At3g10240 [Papaver somniferum]|uniref:putative F-box protein At3g10240 n=1 Tax=Papaver somniferum TaxID=3469 RepID=UPI000E702440|nr:putative F-box protein At3g10240 [Papaver somniferum]